MVIHLHTRAKRYLPLFLLVCLWVGLPYALVAQTPPVSTETPEPLRYRVSGGTLEIDPNAPPVEEAPIPTTRREARRMEKQRVKAEKQAVKEARRAAKAAVADSIAAEQHDHDHHDHAHGADSLPSPASAHFDSLSTRQPRPLSPEAIADSILRADLLEASRYSRIFRDTMPLSRMTAISLVVPGFSQLHNKQAWKIPLLYGTVGGFTYLSLNQAKHYRDYKSQYETLKSQGVPQAELDGVQSEMIRRNTSKTIFTLGAVASYVYFLADGVMNHQGASTSVKKATTLSTVLPGAGQFYNRSYWKVPIVVGAFATMGYVLNYNIQGYNRYQTAYNLVADDDPTTVDEYNGYFSEDQLRTLKDSFRRNRDLSFVILGGIYLLNIVDAHVDAHLRDFDVSDDLAIDLVPTIINLNTYQARTQAVGVALSIRF